MQGVNVRHRAKELLALVNSPDRVREERAKVGGRGGAQCNVMVVEVPLCM